MCLSYFDHVWPKAGFRGCFFPKVLFTQTNVDYMDYFHVCLATKLCNLNRAAMFGPPWTIYQRNETFMHTHRHTFCLHTVKIVIGCEGEGDCSVFVCFSVDCSSGSCPNYTRTSGKSIGKDENGKRNWEQVPGKSMRLAVRDARLWKASKFKNAGYEILVSAKTHKRVSCASNGPTKGKTLPTFVYP